MLIVTYIWFLVVAGAGNVSATVVARFTDQAECRAMASQIEIESRAAGLGGNLHGYCVKGSNSKLVAGGDR